MERDRRPVLPAQPAPQQGEQEEGEAHHGGSFGAYMRHKNSKLQDQFAQLGGDRRQSSLFAGVSIHVNGYTVPSQQELKRLMALHGGGFQVYYSRSSVTHIICSNLPDAKVKQFERERDPTPVVRPEWIVDCIRAGQLLPIQPYVLWQLRDAPGQRTLAAFRRPAPAALPPSAIYGEAVEAPERRRSLAQQQEQQQENGEAEREEGERERVQEQQQERQQQGEGGQEVVHTPHQGPGGRQEGAGQLGVGSTDGRAPEGHSGHMVGSDGPQQGHAGSAHTQQQLPPPPPPQQQQQRSPPLQRPKSGPGGQYQEAGGAPGGDMAGQMGEAQRVAAEMRARCDVLKGAPKSTKDDPDFVDSFYRSSRLHFIGSWKVRVEALMASVGAGSPRPTPPGPMARQRSIIHIDMDCFFASVAEASHPLFKGKPLAVCHSASARGTGEVSSANYAARRYGIAASMFMSRAKELCPQLLVVPYEFDKYEAASEKVYRILFQYSSCVQPLSCDEAFVDVTGLGDPQQLAARMRADIEAATGCTASAGIGPNLLLARLATKRAKPNGQFAVAAGEARAFLSALEVGSLPGVGYQTEQKLREAGLELVSDVQAKPKEFMQQLLGSKAGAALWDFAHGRDSRAVEPPKPRKSVGAEVNWGIRLTEEAEAFRLLGKLAAEVQQRLRAAGVRGRTITLKVKRRKEGAGEPAKFLGHGVCDNLSRSFTLARFTDGAEEVGRAARELLRALRVPPADIRGIGLAVTRLDNDPASAAAKPNAPAPSKLTAPPPSRYDPEGHPAWAALWQQPKPAGGAATLAGQPRRTPSPQQQLLKGALRTGSAGAQQAEHPSQEQQAERAREHFGEHPLLAAEDSAVAQASRSSAEPPASGSDSGAEGRGGWEEDGSDGEGGEGDVPEQQQGVASREQLPTGREPAVVFGQGAQQAPAQVQPRPLAPGGAAVGEGAEAERRRRLLARYEGVALTQIDASEWAELPWSVQKRLIEALPRGRGHAEAQQEQQHQHQLQLLQEQQEQQQQQQQEEGKDMGEAVQQAGAGGQPQLGSDTGDAEMAEAEAACGEAAVPILGSGGSLAAGSGPARDKPTAAAAATTAHAGPCPQAAPAPPGSRGAGASRSSSPIQALPALSQLDPSVMDALPLSLKRELETAYGLAAGIGRTQRSPPGHPKPRRGHAHHSSGSAPPVPKRQRLDSFLSHHPPHAKAGAPPPAAPAAAPAAGDPSRPGGPSGRLPAAAAGNGVPTSLSQVDPSVLEELPEDVRREVLAQLTPGGARRWRLRRRVAGAAGGSTGPGPSRLGLPAAAGAAQRGGEAAEAGQTGGGGGTGQPGGMAAEGEGRGAAGGSSGPPSPLPHELPSPLRQWLGHCAAKQQRSGGASGASSCCDLGSALEQCLRQMEDQWGDNIPGSQGAGAEPGPERAGALDALCSCLVAGCGRLVSGHLDEARAGLQAVQRAGRQHGWFAGAAGRVVERVQGAVEREHGWRLRLGGLLEE